MRSFSAREIPFDVVCLNDKNVKPYPYIRDNLGEKEIYCVSPIHGRSFVITKKEDKHWVVEKGNGLSYTIHPFVDVSENDIYIWGALQKECAVRDFNIGNEVRLLGIKTNVMEYVLELGCKLVEKDTAINPCLLQYEVECPYRLSDYPFMPSTERNEVINSWHNMCSRYSELYLIAAEVLVRNLYLLHKNNIMHNALHIQNYTWALELVDFESARTDNYPFSNYEYERNVLMLKNGEIMKTYEIINYIGWCVGEVLDYSKIEKIFNNYGFGLEQFRINYK